MPIYHAHRAVFVHVPKTAGSSMISALRASCGKPDLGGVGLWDALLKSDPEGRLVRRLRDVYPINSLATFPQQHLPASVLVELVDASIWESYFKFAFVRNPWAMLLSMFTFFGRLSASPDFSKEHVDRSEYITRCDSFDRFVRTYAVSGADMTASISDDLGNCMMDFVGRVENIEADFSRICQRIGISVPLPHVNSSAHGNYRAYYTRETRAVVERLFARDIETYGYSY